MPFLDEFLNGLGDVAQTAGAAAKEAAVSAKAGISVAAEKSRIRTAYETLGKLYFQASEAGHTPVGPQFDAQLKIIRESLNRIRDLRQQQDPCSAPDPDSAPDEDFTDLVIR